MPRSELLALVVLLMLLVWTWPHRTVIGWGRCGSGLHRADPSPPGCLKPGRRPGLGHIAINSAGVWSASRFWGTTRGKLDIVGFSCYGGRWSASVCSLTCGRVRVPPRTRPATPLHWDTTTEASKHMRITGTLLKVEPYSGTFKGDDGQERPYAGIRLHVLEGFEVIKVKVPKELLLTHGYGAGEAVDLAVTVAANHGARGAYLTTTLVGSFEPSGAGTESLAPKPPARLTSAS